ncbi:protein kinase [Pleurocapsales cyanobacterium LEGE 10410]|nr:protein kinase [Pleurocapsales cyanobacterium LEGE 10410]
MESIVGKILCDRYRILRELSQNALSIVYLAEDLREPSLGQCEIERLQPQYDNEVLGTQSWRKTLQTFVDRGNALKNISQHPQIPQLLAFFECDREFYLVQEHIEGQSLRQKLETGLINEAEAVSWLQEILGILEFAHQAEVIHRNIQPSSLIEHQDGRKFLTDFAMLDNAILFSDRSAKNIANADFAPPGETNLDVAGDIYALGKTIIYALTGNITEFIQAKSLVSENTLQQSDSQLAIAEITPKLAGILNKMVGDRSAIRYQSAAEILAELDFNQNVITLPPPFFNTSQLSATPLATAKDKAKHQGNYRSALIQKLIWLLLSLPFVIALVIIFIGINKNSYKDFENYINNNYQFSIKYPETWSRRELDDPITGEVVVFATPQERDLDLFREKVYIAVERLSSEPISLEQYAQTVFERIEQAKNSKIEAAQNYRIKIDETPGRMVIYSRQQEGLQIKQMEAFTIKNNQAYIIIYTAQKNDFPEFYNTVEKMIDSWEIQ